MTAYNSNDLFEALKGIIDIPNVETLAIKLELETDTLPTIEIKSYVQYPDGEKGSRMFPATEVNKFVVVRPWEAPNEHGEYPNGICCMRASGRYCYEHDKNNY